MNIFKQLAQLTWVENTPSTSQERSKTLHPPRPTSVLDMILNNLMVTLVMEEFQEMQGTPSLPLLPDRFWPGEEASIYGSKRTSWHLKWVQTNELC